MRFRSPENNIENLCKKKNVLARTVSKIKLLTPRPRLLYQEEGQERVRIFRAYT